MQPCGAHLSDPGVDTCCNLCNVPHEKQQQEEVHRGGLPLGVFVFSEDTGVGWPWEHLEKSVVLRGQQVQGSRGTLLTQSSSVRLERRLGAPEETAFCSEPGGGLE